MDLPAAFGFWNGLVPIAALMGLAVVLPWPLAGWAGLDQRRLALVMGLVAADLWLTGALILAGLTFAEGGAVVLAPLDLAWRSARLALAWGPVWAVVWLIRAQGIERQKGLRMGGVE